MNTTRLKSSRRATRKQKPRRKKTRWAISKHDLAMQYSPSFTPHGSLKRLSRWIKYCTPLYNALKRDGYNDMQKNFSKRQLSLIYRHLGPP